MCRLQIYPTMLQRSFLNDAILAQSILGEVSVKKLAVFYELLLKLLPNSLV